MRATFIGAFFSLHGCLYLNWELKEFFEMHIGQTRLFSLESLILIVLDMILANSIFAVLTHST